MWLNAYQTLSAAELGERAGVTFCLEILIRSSITPAHPWPAPTHPGTWWNPSHTPNPQDDARPLPRTDRRRKPHRKTVRRCGDKNIGEIQVADVPGRCEPGTGEINYPAIGTR